MRQGGIQFQSIDIIIPIDSRLENLYKKYSLDINNSNNLEKKENNISKERSPAFPTKDITENNTIKTEKIKKSKIKLFYKDIAESLDIEELHLDAILWVNYEELINMH